MAKYSEARIEEIREHLAELTYRGISVAQYAEEIGVSVWTVYTWRKRFGAGRGQRAKQGARERADLIEIDRAPPSAIEIVAGAVTISRAVSPTCASRSTASPGSSSTFCSMTR